MEKEEIILKLQAEGLNEAYADVIKVETEDELDSHISKLKELQPEPQKKLEDYTVDELEELAKTNKSIQGLTDRVRTKAAQSKKPPETKPPQSSEELLAIKEKLEKIESDRVKDKIERKVKAAFDDKEDVDIVLLKIGDDQEKVDTAIADHKKYLESKIPGFKPGQGRRKQGEMSEARRLYREKRKSKK